MNQLQACISYSYPQKKMVDAFFLFFFFCQLPCTELAFLVMNREPSLLVMTNSFYGLKLNSHPQACELYRCFY